MTSTVSTDADLYQLMHDLGDKSVRERVQRLRESGQFTNTGPGAKLAAEAGGKLYKEFKKWVEQRRTNGHGRRVVQLIKDIGLERLCAVTIRYLVNRASSRDDKDMTVTACRNGLSLYLRDEAEFVRFSKIDPVAYRFAERDLKEATPIKRSKIRGRFVERNKDNPDALDWDRADRYMLAATAIGMAVTHAGIFEAKRRKFSQDFDRRAKPKYHQVIKLRKEVMEWLTEGINFVAEFSPIYLPITTPPADWGPNQEGGYHERTVPNIRFMTTRSPEQRKALRRSDCPDLYKALNTLQRTSWKINKDSFMMLQHAVENRWTRPAILTFPPEEPTPPDGEYQRGDPAWIQYGRQRRQYRVLDERYRKDRYTLSRTITTGRVLEPFDRFYYPHQIDYRSRCYPIGAPLQYQGPDVQRGILEFADGKPIGDGAPWFLINGANCYGVDKVPFEDRIKWVEENADAIRASADDPICNRFWADAESPFQFLAWAIEFDEFCDKGPWETINRVPIGMDGSNNGLQIYSLLLRDQVGADATNCAPSEFPQDIYSRVAEKATDYLREYVRSGEDRVKVRWAKRMLEFLDMLGEPHIPRKAVKRPVMTLPYGSTLYKCQQYLAEWYHDFVRGKNFSSHEQPFRERDSYNALNWIGSVVWDSIGEVVVKAMEAMRWLREVSDICADNRIHCEWTTPLGLKVRQDYVKGDYKKIRLKAGGQLALSIWQRTDEVDPRRSRNGLCPNFVHSLDASAMFNAVNLASESGVTHFRMIHDSFATHACDAPVMAAALRESFVSIFEHDWLEALRRELMKALPDGVELPDHPDKGTFNIQDLHSSKYFFA